MDKDVQRLIFWLVFVAVLFVIFVAGVMQHTRMLQLIDRIDEAGIERDVFLVDFSCVEESPIPFVKRIEHIPVVLYINDDDLQIASVLNYHDIDDLVAVENIGRVRYLHDKPQTVILCCYDTEISKRKMRRELWMLIGFLLFILLVFVAIIAHIFGFL